MIPHRKTRSVGVGVLNSFLILSGLTLIGAELKAAPAGTNAPADSLLAQGLKTADTNLVNFAITQGANVNAPATNAIPPVLQLLSGRTSPLSPEERHCLALLIEHGANPDVLDRDGRNPLIHAARAGDLETVKLLVETGNVYVRTRDRFHTTALLYAARAHNRPIVLYLASNGDIQSPTVRERRERGRR